MKPTRRLTPAENAKVVVLKQASPSFVVMRQLAMRFRSILRGDDPDKLNNWLHDAKHSWVRSMQRLPANCGVARKHCLVTRRNCAPKERCASSICCFRMIAFRRRARRRRRGFPIALRGVCSIDWSRSVPFGNLPAAPIFGCMDCSVFEQSGNRFASRKRAKKCDGRDADMRSTKAARADGAASDETRARPSRCATGRGANLLFDADIVISRLFGRLI